jgi:parallel beta-helix repeat protein
MRITHFKSALVAGIFSFFIIVCCVPSTLSTTDALSNRIFYVGGNGLGNYTSIQTAIDNAQHGDTIFVYHGTYFEHDIIINDSLRIIGEDNTITVVNAEKRGSVFVITADDCMIAGFTLINCRIAQNDYTYALVRIHSNNNTVMNNRFSIMNIEWNAWMAAIDVVNASHNKILRNQISDEMTGRIIGILLRNGSSTNIISGNDISGYCDGVKSGWATINGFNNVLSENFLHENGDGIDTSGNGDSILANRFFHNMWNGIRIENGQHIISDNEISFNGWGNLTGEFDGGIIVCGQSDGNTISNNHIRENNPSGLYVLNSYKNKITHNNFIDNGISAEHSEKFWANAYFYYGGVLYSLIGNTWKNNYWSDYRGIGPKIIHGDIELFSIGLAGFGPSWINFDWFPARTPYHIV